MVGTWHMGAPASIGLPYLISEGILPENPPRDSYQLDRYVFPEPSNGDDDDDSGIFEEHEIVATNHCVVWSQDRFVRNVYRFDLEGETVVQAILTHFPTQATTEASHSGSVALAQHTGRGQESNLAVSTSSRALLVFLRSKAHIHFLQGSTFILDLPIEVERALPAPNGVVIQKKASTVSLVAPTPLLPAAPPNSFLSPQIRTTSSYLLSPIPPKNFTDSQASVSSPKGGANRLDALFRGAFGNPAQSAEEDLAPLYSLTNPLSDLGVVTSSLQQQNPRFSGKSRPGIFVEFEPLDASEALVYVSPADELGNASQRGRGPVMLMVTRNADLQNVTLWHAWYVDEASLAALTKQRTAQNAAKARRRSSFLSAGMGTGTTTPAVRQREANRESLAAGSLRLPGEPAVPAATAPSSRKPTRQEEEDAMASQMDPDYQPTTSHRSARESRRISSLNSDLRASQTAPNPSFGGGGRRNTSFGGANDRRSFGHRKSRGSTPGSIFSRSIGPDDDLMDVDVSFDSDGSESVDGILRHMRATHEAAGADSIFGGAEGDLKRDLVVRKLHSLPLARDTSHASTETGIHVCTLADSIPRAESDNERLNVYIHEGKKRTGTCVRLLIKHRPLYPAANSSAVVAIPLVLSDTKFGSCTDIVKLKDKHADAILLPEQGLIVSVGSQAPCPIPDKAILSAQAGPGHAALYPEAVATPDDAVRSVSHPGRIKLWPDDDRLGRLLRLCQLILPQQQADVVLWLWCAAHTWLVEHPDELAETTRDGGWVAFAATVFGFAIPLMDESTRMAIKEAQRSSERTHTKTKLSCQAQEASLLGQAAWHRLLEYHGGSQNRKEIRIDEFILSSAVLADRLLQSVPEEISPAIATGAAAEVSRLMLGLHIFREEQKLSVLTAASSCCENLAAIVAQLGNFLGLPSWSFRPGSYYELEGAGPDHWTFIDSGLGSPKAHPPLMTEPIGIFHWFEYAVQHASGERYPTLDIIVAAADRASHQTQTFQKFCRALTPHVTALSDVVEATLGLTGNAVTTVQIMAQNGVTIETIEVLPSAVATPFREAIAASEKEPPTTWPPDLLRLVGRDDLDIDAKDRPVAPTTLQSGPMVVARDVQTICNALEHHPHAIKTREADRHAVSQLLFKEDRRLVEATSLMHYNSSQVAECPKQPDWNDVYHLEQQRKVMQWVTIRMISLPAGDAMLHYDSQTPLLTDRYHLAGFSNSCLMQPMGHTLTTDRTGLNEERVNWAYFHAGVSAGLRISKNIKGIDTSWIAFNKPNDLTNRHAGLLLALGLNGHLRNLAKWLSFKYLTPKHTMTSVGLLLGLSASYMGTMDGLITRMLSVHITRMLPAGAAELNVSPITQTAGLMGIGLLYYNTQHRRVSEIMLSEIEHMELEDPDSGPDPLRDESYRLAAGFALGFINLGKGRDLRGLHGMYLPERLLAVAIGPRPVHAVHVFDRATAGAVVAVALVYMKSGDTAIASKIDIPDTEAQFDHVRPDILMLRAMSKHLILWDSIDVKTPRQNGAGWIRSNLPKCFDSRFQQMLLETNRGGLNSSDIPFFNITTGLVWALSLKYAGSGSEQVRDEILTVLDFFSTLLGAGRGHAYARFANYDIKLTRATLRRCIDAVAVFAATVMAGTGDLKTFRYLRRLHGRTDPETTYGSHLAAHLAIGILFLGGGTYTFGTSDRAIASLICAFYPLYPTDVHDNHVHLQAFRHLWVFAAEARCLIVEDIDTQRPISIPIVVTLKDGTSKSMTGPGLLPELDTIARVRTDEPSYWRVTLDFADNPQHLAGFKENQRIFVRRCPAAEAHSSVFSATLSALHEAPSTASVHETWHSIFRLPAFKDLDRADLELILPPDLHSSIYTAARGTVVDDRLSLDRSIDAVDRDGLWNLRLLFAWAEKARTSGSGRLKWIGTEVVEALKARVEDRRRLLQAHAAL